MLKRENKTDVIVVGAGPAGISCAITLARAGKEVVLIERGMFAGAKNMFGGAVYTDAVKEMISDMRQKREISANTIVNELFKQSVLRWREREQGMDDITIICVLLK